VPDVKMCTNTVSRPFSLSFLFLLPISSRPTNASLAPWHRGGYGLRHCQLERDRPSLLSAAAFVFSCLMAGGGFPGFPPNFQPPYGFPPGMPGMPPGAPPMGFPPGPPPMGFPPGPMGFPPGMPPGFPAMPPGMPPMMHGAPPPGFHQQQGPNRVGGGGGGFRPRQGGYPQPPGGMLPSPTGPPPGSMANAIPVPVRPPPVPLKLPGDKPATVFVGGLSPETREVFMDKLLRVRTWPTRKRTGSARIHECLYFFLHLCF
jgi:hypothetical protein